MATNETLIPVGGRLHSVAVEGHVAGADEIYDDDLQKLQSTINAETKAEIGANNQSGTVKGRITALEESVGAGGSIDTRIDAAVNELDSEVSIEDSNDSNPLNITVIQTNGKLTEVTGSIDAETFDAYGAADTVKTELLGDVEELDTLGKLEDAISNVYTKEAADAAHNSLSSAISAEATARDAADVILNQSIVSLQNEDVNIKNSITGINSRINTLDSNLAKEIRDRVADVDAEEARAIAAEGLIDADLQQHKTDCANALTTAITNEAAARSDADALINTDIAALQVADGVLQQDIANEISNRKKDAVHSAVYYNKNGEAQPNGVSGSTVNINTVNNPKIVFYNGNATKSPLCAINVGDYFVEGNYYTKTDIDGKIATINGTNAGLDSSKADKVSNAVAGNFAGLDENGNLVDSGSKAADFKTKQTAVNSPTASGDAVAFIDTIIQNANGVITATKKNVQNASSSKNGLMSMENFSKLNALPTNSDLAAALATKADKVAMEGNEAATENNFFAIDATGNLKDSGYSKDSFMAANSAYVKSETMTSTEIMNAINNVSIQAQGAIAGSYTIGQTENRLWEKADRAQLQITPVSGNSNKVHIQLLPAIPEVKWSTEDANAYNLTIEGAIAPDQELTAEEASLVNDALSTLTGETFNYAAGDIIGNNAYAYNSTLTTAGAVIAGTTTRYRAWSEVSTDVLTNVDLSGLVVKPASFTANNFASYDSTTGKVVDSGKSAADFADKSYEGIVDNLGDAIGVLDGDAIKEVQVAGTTLTKAEGSVNIPAVTTTAAGVMTNTDKVKLNGIAAGAQVNVIESVTLNNSNDGVTVSGKNVNLTVMNNTVDNLQNYYKKIETYTKTEIQNAIEQANSVGLPMVTDINEADVSGSMVYKPVVTVGGNSVNIFTSPISIPCLVGGAALEHAYGEDGTESFVLHDANNNPKTIIPTFSSLDEDKTYLITGSGNDYSISEFEGIPFVKPDFNQNNEGALDYIKNRPSQTLTIQKGGVTVGTFTAGVGGANATINIVETDPEFTNSLAKKSISGTSTVTVYGQREGSTSVDSAVLTANGTNSSVTVDSRGISLATQSGKKAYYNDAEIATKRDLENISVLDGITKDDEGNLWKEDNNGLLNPLQHPNLSTQPSLLPYRFGLFPIYEVLCPFINGDFDTKMVPQEGIVIGGSIFGDDCCEGLSCKWVSTTSFSVTTKKLVIANIVSDFTPEFALVRYYTKDILNYYNYKVSLFWGKYDNSSNRVLVDAIGRALVINSSDVVTKNSYGVIDLVTVTSVLPIRDNEMPTRSIPASSVSIENYVLTMTVDDVTYTIHLGTADVTPKIMDY